MTVTGDRIEARERVIAAALAIAAAERHLAGDDTAMTAITAATERMELAARDLTNAVDDTPPPQRPKGWARDGAVTA